MSGHTDTNSNDPELLKCRLFVGRLPTDKMNRAELEEMFSVYGKVKAALLLTGYGFIQYDNVESAEAAIEGENGKLLKGVNIDVKFAAEGRKKDGGAGPSQRGFSRGRGRGEGHGRGEMRGRGGGRGRGEDGYLHGRGGYDDSYRDRSPIRDAGFPPREGGFPPRGGGFRGRGRGAFRGGPPGGPPNGPDEFHRNRTINRYEELGGRGHQEDYRAPPSAPVVTPVSGMERPAYECEIVLTAPRSRPYAEHIESKIKANGLLTSLNLLQDKSMLPRVLEDVAQRNVPFAVIVNSDNEVHSSLTVNILHGTPQEHRNMPAADAMLLIAKHFEIYLQDLRQKMSAKTAGAPAAPEFIPPDKETHYLLNLLADNRILTVAELDKVISYLEQRRARIQGRKTVAEPKGGPSDQDLQDKILKILNTAGTGGPGADESRMAQAPSASAAYPSSSSDPSIQAAIDKLMHNSSHSAPAPGSTQAMSMMQEYGNYSQ